LYLRRWVSFPLKLDIIVLMKAIQINGYGGIDVLEINTNVSKPTLKKD